MSRRLIEEWLPIAALGEESVRERRSMTALPPTYYLHVWWARRPLVASRAAIMASLLPEDADRDRFLHALGIHGDPVATKRRIDIAKRTGENLGPDPYGYKRAFLYHPTSVEEEWLRYEAKRVDVVDPIVLDPTAGGGSIPFEAVRSGLSTIANDLNPVASLVIRSTIEGPARFGLTVRTAFGQLAKEFLKKAEPRFQSVFPKEPNDAQVLGYLWTRTITCPYCDGLIPLSPNWKLAPGGIGVRLHPRTNHETRRCSFEIVDSANHQSEGTVSGGKATCPYPDCGRVIDGNEVKSQAQAGNMGEQLYAVVFKKRVLTTTKAGKSREKWVRSYRAPRPEDDNQESILRVLSERLPEWEALDIAPTEAYDEMFCDRSKVYGVNYWRDLFSPRQLLGHGITVEVYRELLQEYESKDKLDEVTKAAFGYLAFCQDKLLNYNSRLCRWDTTTERCRSTFDTHNYAFVWSYAEMAPLMTGLGFEWAVKQTAKCIAELVDLTRPDINVKQALKSGHQSLLETYTPPPITITCKSGDNLDHIADGSVDTVVMDPPYYDNVMYAELSDFFYVWLKRTAGYIYPELFRRPITDKEQEAVANPTRFKGQKGAKQLAYVEYRERMAAIFAECRRVLKVDGIMTLMFTHKATGAWDALTKGLMEAGFVITASWPINTEAEASMHIKDKSAANSTVFLVCRPREETLEDQETLYWEDLEHRVRKAVRSRIASFQEAGIRGVDLYLSAFGPALEEFSRHWPVKRGTPKPRPAKKRGQQLDLLGQDFDPYEATPEDALDTARREVKQWRLEQLTDVQRRGELDPLTEWFVLAWDSFQAPQFPYDEALRLARVVGVDLDTEIIGHVANKKTSYVVLWDASTRAAKGALGPADGRRSMLDALHHAAHMARTRNLDAAKDLLTNANVSSDPSFLTALEAVLEVLPPSKAYTGFDPVAAALPAANDFEALENLRRLAFSTHVDEPKQLSLLHEEDM